MSVNERVFHAPAEAVWNVLSDGWLYPLWVVGATRMREVDDDWPRVGSKLHHSVGVWPAVIDDSTEVTEMELLTRLKVKARGWPMGEAYVTLELEELEGDTTNVRIIEDATAGPGALIPRVLRRPMLRARNHEALARLAHLTEGRAEDRKA